MPSSSHSSRSSSTRMPSSTCSLFGGPSSAPSVTIQTLLVEASVSQPSRNMIVSSAPWSADIWRAITLPSSEMHLMSPRSQRKSRAVMQATPWCRCSARGRLHRVAHHEDRRRDAGRHHVVAQRDAARHLDVDQLVRRALGSPAPRPACGSARAIASRAAGSRCAPWRGCDRAAPGARRSGTACAPYTGTTS